MSDTIENTSDTGSTVVEAHSTSTIEAPSYIQRRSIGQLLRGDLGFLPVLLLSERGTIKCHS